MKKRNISTTALISLAVLTLIFAATRTLQCDPAQTYVKKVFDGDSILLSDGREVRYIGIDTPETGGYKPEEYYGEEAREINEGLVLGKEVTLEFDVERVDGYGRILAYVYAGDTFVNLEMVRRGAAVAMPYPPNLKHHKELSIAMEDAREEGVGIWKYPDLWMIAQYDAHKYLGLSKTVVGRVVSTQAKDFGVFLNFGVDYRTDFTTFIPSKYLPYFHDEGISYPEIHYMGRVVEITGVLHEEKGPSITVYSPCQIYISE